VNREDEFELRLAEWLEAGPFSAPDHAVEAAIRHAQAHPRRRLLSAAFRRSAMNETHAAPVVRRRFLRVGRAFAAGMASIALVAILVVSGLALLAPRQTNTGGPGPAATPTPTPSSAHGYIYWANHKDGTIGRANLDGTGVNQSFVTGATSPCGVAVIGSYIYWSNDQDNTIGRANLDGTGVTPRLITDTGGACGLASDGTHLYWTNRSGEYGSIGRANLDGTEVNLSFISGGSPTLVGVAISGSYIYIGSAAASIGRANLDFGGFVGSSIGLSGVPGGIAISGNYIYWGNSDSTTIGRATLDGMEMNESFIRISGNPGGLATDGTHLYWSSAGAIGRANLDGTGVNQSFIGGASVPTAVAIGG
jgi:hypothetical protein